MFPVDNSTKITEIRDLIRNGKFDNALSIIEENENQTNIRIAERFKFQLLRIEVYNEIGRYDEALKLSENILNNSQKLEDSLQMLDAVTSKAKSLSHLGEFGKSLAYIKLGERIIDKLKDVDTNQLFSRKAILSYSKGQILEEEEDLKTALDNYLRSLSLRREIDDKSGLLLSNNSIARIYFKMGDVTRALLIFQQCLSSAREIGNDKAAADILDSISRIYLWRGEYGPALENSLQCLALSEELGNQKLIANALNGISLIYNHLGELERSLQNLERCLVIREEIDDKIGTAETLNTLSYVLFLKGELNEATKYLNQGQEILVTRETPKGLANIFKTVGMILYQRGDFDQSIEQLSKCLDYWRDYKNKKEYIRALFWLILVNIENNSLEIAQEQLKKMQKIIEKQSNLENNLRYKLVSALVLKKSSNLDILRKANNIFNEIISGETIDLGLSAISIFNLCELYLKQMHLNNNKDDMKNLEALIDKHLKIAKQIESHAMYAENFWLKANTSLLNHNVPEAKLYLEQAEQITEEKGLRRFGMKITRALEIINKRLEEAQTQNIDDKIISLEQETADVNNDVVRMIDRRTIEIPKLQEEEPVLLIIVYEGGVTVFSKKFSHKEMIDEMFVGGFLTAIDAFMHQTFATGGSIERIQHQEYTLLLKVENPLLFCYVFKGQSFTAIQKLDQIIKELKKSNSMWHALTVNSGEQLGDIEKDTISELADQVFIIEEEK